MKKNEKRSASLSHRSVHRSDRWRCLGLLTCVLVAACGGEDPGAPAHARATADGGSDPGDPGGGGAGGNANGMGGAGGEFGYGGAGPVTCDGPGARFITQVAEVSFGPGQDYGRQGMPDIVFGPPRGGGTTQGSLDVVSLGNGGSIVVAFAGNAIVDGPGPDFVVFENPFETGDGVFAELASVAVSDDGETWHTFPCTASAAPYGSCAGHTPVLLDGEEGPFEASAAGGDAFDLAELGVSEARYVRVTDREDLDGLDGVFDLDAIGIVHPACP